MNLLYLTFIFPLVGFLSIYYSGQNLEITRYLLTISQYQIDIPLAHNFGDF